MYKITSEQSKLNVMFSYFHWYIVQEVKNYSEKTYTVDAVNIINATIPTMIHHTILIAISQDVNRIIKLGTATIIVVTNRISRNFFIGI